VEPFTPTLALQALASDALAAQAEPILYAARRPGFAKALAGPIAGDDITRADQLVILTVRDRGARPLLPRHVARLADAVAVGRAADAVHTHAGAAIGRRIASLADPALRRASSAAVDVRLVAALLAVGAAEVTIVDNAIAVIILRVARLRSAGRVLFAEQSDQRLALHRAGRARAIKTGRALHALPGDVIVGDAVAIVVEPVAGFRRRRHDRIRMTLQVPARLARINTLRADTEFTRVIARLALLGERFIDQPIAIVIDGIANLQRGHLRRAVVRRNDPVDRHTCRNRYGAGSRATRQHRQFIDLTVAVVVEAVARIRLGQHFADAHAPHTLLVTGLRATLAGANAERINRIGVTRLRLSFGTRTVLVDFSVTVVVDVVAQLGDREDFIGASTPLARLVAHPDTILAEAGEIVVEERARFRNSNDTFLRGRNFLRRISGGAAVGREDRDAQEEKSGQRPRDGFIHGTTTYALTSEVK